VGIVLSEQAIDGSLRMKDIKNHWRHYIAQDPGKLQNITGMPQNAVNSGMVDFI